MLLFLALAGSVVQLRPNAGPITPEQAKAMTPAALGNALLASGHAGVSEATVGPQGMEEPPTPPGQPQVIKIRLYFEASPSKQRGFCERSIATIFLKPVFRAPDGSVPPAAPDTLSTQVSYRWAGGEQGAARCKGLRLQYFTPQTGYIEEALTTVRLLFSAQKTARGTRHLPFLVTLVDKEGPEMAAFEQTRAGKPKNNWEILTDARAALASLPIGSVSYAGPASMAYPYILLPSDLIDARGKKLEGRTVFLGGDWTAGLVLDDGRISRIRLLRQIPAPF